MELIKNNQSEYIDNNMISKFEDIYNEFNQEILTCHQSSALLYIILSEIPELFYIINSFRLGNLSKQTYKYHLKNIKRRWIEYKKEKNIKDEISDDIFSNINKCPDIINVFRKRYGNLI